MEKACTVHLLTYLFVVVDTSSEQETLSGRYFVCHRRRSYRRYCLIGEAVKIE